MKKVAIVGAGLAGLIAACHFKNGPIIEAGRIGQQHQALLRFRTTEVAAMTGIEFKQVKVRKEIWARENSSSVCTIRDANQYAKKVSGSILERSILNLAPEVRYIAPDDFYPQLVDRHQGRIYWEFKFEREQAESFQSEYVPIISTAPMPANLRSCGIDPADAWFGFAEARKVGAPITVRRYGLKSCDVYQTIYFPEPSTDMFRASITGDALIIESVGSNADESIQAAVDLELVLRAFGLGVSDFVDINDPQVTVQGLGKIIDMPRDLRQALLYRMTSQHGMFSLGRFATWRNILLDDVVGDVKVLDGLVNASEYSRHKLLSGK